VAAWNPVAVAIKGRSKAAAVEAELVKAGVEPVIVGGGAWAQYCGGFLNAAMGAKLSHSGQSELTDAAAAVVKKPMPAGDFVFDEDAAGVSAGPLFSATLAHGALQVLGNNRRPKPARPTSGPERPVVAELDVMGMAF
jgi:hypothetical protein